MFAKSVIALAAIASVAVAAPVEKRGAPAGWAYGYLENYDVYHVRYLALKCYEQKHTDFFQACCRPMLSTETLAANRASYCVPSAEDVAYVTSSLSGETATATASADKASESEYCDTEESASVAAPSNSAVKAAATSSVVYSAAATTSSSAWVAASSAAAPAAASSSVAAVEYVAPAKSSSTSTTPAYTPTSTYTPPAPTTTSTTPAYTPPAPAPTTKAPSNGGGQSMDGGFATYFYQNGNPGACGNYNSDGAMIVAIDQARWGQSSFGQKSDTCGRWLTITNTNNGRSVSAMVADVCPTCTNGNSLDLSVGAFNAIASEADGMVPISWHWN